MSYSTNNTATIRHPSSILNTLYFGAEYFRKVYKLASYLGDGQVAIDAAEILYQLVLRDNADYISRDFLSAYLCMDTQKVAKAIFMLKKAGMVISYKKGYIITPYIPQDRKWTDDEALDFFNTLHCFDYDEEMDRIWELMTLIYTIRDFIGLGIPECSRRHFVVCMCMGKPFDCSAPKAKQISEALLNLDFMRIGNQYSVEDYQDKMEKYVEWKKDKHRLLIIYQRAKMIITHPYWWKKNYAWYIPQESIDVAKKAQEYFPRNDKESLRETLNKWNKYCYEYIVHQPTTDDYDFNPCSPFYGLPLEKRLEMLPKAIGENSEEYQRGYLTQEQWVGVFNAEGTDFLKHEFPKEKIAIISESRKWERERKKRR